MVNAVSRVQPVDYAEIIATVASRSIGPGTRKNIDEFTRTTSAAIEKVGGAAKGKAIVVINRSEEHTSELQSLMRISYAVFCLKKKNEQKLKIKNKKYTHQDST